MTRAPPTEVKSYYTKDLPYVVAQPRVRQDIVASLLTKNANEYAAQQEWEAEWNQAGLASRLSEKVWLRTMGVVCIYYSGND